MELGLEEKHNKKIKQLKIIKLIRHTKNPSKTKVSFNIRFRFRIRIQNRKLLEDLEAHFNVFKNTLLKTC